jgi:hypothetical protein
MERTHHHCEYDFATGRTDLLVCGLIDDHRVVLMPERRAALERRNSALIPFCIIAFKGIGTSSK